MVAVVHSSKVTIFEMKCHFLANPLGIITYEALLYVFFFFLGGVSQGKRQVNLNSRQKLSLVSQTANQTKLKASVQSKTKETAEQLTIQEPFAPTE